MIDPTRIARMRKLLADSSNASSSAASGRFIFSPSTMPMTEAIKRRATISSISYIARHYDLRHDVDAFIACAGQGSLAALDQPQLNTLASWVHGVVDRMNECCDSPDDPPAR